MPARSPYPDLRRPSRPEDLPTASGRDDQHASTVHHQHSYGLFSYYVSSHNRPGLNATGQWTRPLCLGIRPMPPRPTRSHCLPVTATGTWSHWLR